MMKLFKYLFFVAFLVLMACNKPNTKYDWKDYSLGNPVDLKAISMLNENVGFIGGIPPRDSVSYRTYYPNFPPNYYEEVNLMLEMDSTQVWYKFYAETLYPSLYKTSDGGISWEGIETPFTGGIKHLDFVSERVGFVVTEEQGVFKTTDGGANWQSILSNFFQLYPFQQVMNCIDRVTFIDENTGFAYDKTDDLVLKTIDGGLNWECLNLPYPPNRDIPAIEPTLFGRNIELIYFTNKDTGYVSNENGEKLFQTVNGGDTWNQIAMDQIFYGDVLFHENVIFNPTYAVLSLDKGVTWNKTTFQQRVDYGCLVSKERMYYVRHRETIYSVRLDERYGEAMSSEISPLLISAMVFPSQNIGIAIGDNGAVLRYTK